MGKAGFSGDDALAVNAALNLTYGVAVDSVGNVIVADQKNRRIRKITISTGNIATLAGSVICGSVYNFSTQLYQASIGIHKAAVISR